MPRDWKLARSLIRLRDQINAAFPDRSKVSDGSVGDQQHASRPSDHNPNAAGYVTAIDVTHDPEHGCDGRALSQAITTDPRCKYVIFSGMIWKKRTGKWEPYRGPNPHDHHVHISVIPDSIKDDSVWAGINPTWVTPVPAPVVAARRTLRLRDTGDDVAEVQRKLLLEPDRQFGYRTQSAVISFQRAHGLNPDGVVGKDTWAALDEITR